MNRNRRLVGAAVATAAAMLFVAGGGVATAADDGGAVKVKCYGANACKGQAECKTSMNACKGHNACKGKGFVTTELVTQIVREAAAAGKIVAADPNPQHSVDWRGVTVVKPNRAEAFLAAGIPWHDAEEPPTKDADLEHAGGVQLRAQRPQELDDRSRVADPTVAASREVVEQVGQRAHLGAACNS